MKNFVLIVLLGLAIAAANVSCGRQAGNKQVRDLAEYVKETGKSPVEFVLESFKDHDVVILGERHYIKDNPLLVQELIPVLHKHGINVLATEHARAEDQYLIDSLLAGADYDEALAKKITFLGYVHWPFKEYIDIYRTAWDVNHERGADEPAFRILGMNCSPDWSIMKKPADREVDSLKRAVWRGCREKDWAKVVLDAVESGEKVLAFCGIHHGFTKYGQPIVIDGKFYRFDRSRFGNCVYEALGDRVMTVFMHAPFDGPAGYDDDIVLPADGYIDQAMAILGPGSYPVGFDVAGSPLSDMPLTNSVYAHGYEPFTLDEFCDGYIYTRPIDQFEAVSIVDGFVTEENLDYAHKQTPNPGYRDFTVEEYYRDFEDDMRGLEESWHELGLKKE